MSLKKNFGYQKAWWTNSKQPYWIFEWWIVDPPLVKELVRDCGLQVSANVLSSVWKHRSHHFKNRSCVLTSFCTWVVLIFIKRKIWRQVIRKHIYREKIPPILGRFLRTLNKFCDFYNLYVTNLDWRKFRQNAPSSTRNFIKERGLVRLK